MVIRPRQLRGEAARLCEELASAANRPLPRVFRVPDGHDEVTFPTLARITESSRPVTWQENPTRALTLLMSVAIARLPEGKPEGCAVTWRHLATTLYGLRKDLPPKEDGTRYNYNDFNRIARTDAEPKMSVRSFHRNVTEVIRATLAQKLLEIKDEVVSGALNLEEARTGEAILASVISPERVTVPGAEEEGLPPQAQVVEAKVEPLDTDSIEPSRPASAQVPPPTSESLGAIIEKRPRQDRRPIDPRLEEILRNLANLVQLDLQSQERWRQDNEPFLSVSYTAAPSHLHDHWDNICNVPGAEPIPLDGTLDRIADTFISIPSRRLVVLGRAGAGKTTLSTKLALALLDPARCSPNEVPVVFYLSSWSPEQSLDDWLSSQLIAYSELNEIFQQRMGLAAELVRSRHIVPILDGFDEIDPSLRVGAIRMLNTSRSYGEPLIITSRPGEYVEAIESGGYVDYAPAVTLEDLAADEVARYLPLTALKLKSDEKQARERENRTKWDPVIAAIRENHQEGSHGAILLEVLSTPLMVFLARRIYSDDSSVDVNDLLDPALFPDANAISNHLIDQYVRTVYEQPSHNQASKNMSLSPAEAHYRLACYAVFLHSLGVRDWSSFRNEVKKTRSIEVPFPISRIKFLADGYRESARSEIVAKRYRGARFHQFKVEFLEDARRRGILQKSGQEYMFRHSLLQDRLAYDALTGPTRRRLGNPKFRSRSMRNLAILLFRSGRFKEAELLIEEALHLQNNRPGRRDGPFRRRPAEWHIEYSARKVQWNMDVYKGGSSSGFLLLRPYRRE